MADDSQTSPCTSFSNAREQQYPENFIALLSTEPQEPDLWSPPPDTSKEESFLPLIDDEWINKLVGSNVQPAPPSSESQEIQQIRKLEQRVRKLQQ